MYFFTYNTHYLTGNPIPEVKEYVFAFEVNPDTIATINNNPCNEHEEVGWFSFEECINKMKWPENKKALTKLNDSLLKQN